MVWEETHVTGEGPSARYGHTMEVLPVSSSSSPFLARVLVFGGTSQSGLSILAFNDVFILEVLHASVGQWRVDAVAPHELQWPRRDDVVMPCPRSRHAMTRVHDSILVFGGSDEGYQGSSEGAEARGRSSRVREVETQVYELTVRHGTSGARWGAKPMRIVAIPHEPPVMLAPGGLKADMHRLLHDAEMAEGASSGSSGVVGMSSDLTLQAVGEGDEEEESGWEGEGEGGPLVKAHKVMLCLRCAHFRAMLGSGMREASETTVTLHGLHPNLLRALLLYIYTDTLHPSAARRPELCLPLLIAASRFTLDGLVALCEGVLRAALDRDNCLDLLRWADTYQLPGLKTMALSVLARHRKTLLPPLGLFSKEQLQAAAAAPASPGGESPGSTLLPPHLRREVAELIKRVREAGWMMEEDEEDEAAGMATDTYST